MRPARPWREVPGLAAPRFPRLFYHFRETELLPALQPPAEAMLRSQAGPPPPHGSAPCPARPAALRPGPQRLCVLACEAGGRLSAESLRLVTQLARLRARRAPAALRGVELDAELPRGCAFTLRPALI